MPRPKRKLTRAERDARARRRAEYMTIFVGGKQKKVPRPQLIDGLSVEEFIARNADPVWLVQHEIWDVVSAREVERGQSDSRSDDDAAGNDEDEIPF